MFALPLFAAANSSTIQSFAASVQAIFTDGRSVGDNQAIVSAEDGIARLSSDGQEVVQVATGGPRRSFLAIREDGTLWAWGENHRGQLGVGDINNRSVPTQVLIPGGTDDDWATVTTAWGGMAPGGSPFTLALKTDGTLWAWGGNYYGQLGLGVATGTANNHNSRNTPHQVGLHTDWEFVTVGTSFAFGIRANGLLYSWGQNAHGQTGRNTDSGNTNAPARVGAQTDWRYVDAGWGHALALRGDGMMYAWGNNQLGRTTLGGNGTSPGNTLTPQRITANNAGGATRWLDVSAGAEYSLAIRSDGTLWAWGNRANGLTGLIPASTTDNAAGRTERLTPRQVGTDNNWQFVNAGSDMSMGIRTNGTLWSWGNNDGGRLGLGTTGGVMTTPVQIGTDTDWNVFNSLNGGPSAAAKANGAFWLWGNAEPTFGQFAKGITGNGGSTYNRPWRVAASLIPQAANNWLPSSVAAGSATAPYNTAVQVPIDTSLTIRFDRTMRTDIPGTITLTPSGSGPVVTADMTTATWGSGTHPGILPASAQIPNSVLTVDLLDSLEFSTTYRVTVEGFIDAQFGLVGINEMYPHGFDTNHPTPRYPYTSWAFSTERRLAVDNITPAGTNVATSTANLVITFNDLVDIPHSGTVTLNGTPLTFGPGNFSVVSGVSVLTIPFPTPLAYGTSYTVVVSNFRETGATTEMEPYTHTFATAVADTAIQKNLQLPEGTTTPNITFYFDITPHSLNGDTSAPATATLPPLATQTITFTTADTGVADANGTVTITRFTSSDLLAGVTFPHAGLFRYIVTERYAGTTQTVDSGTMYFEYFTNRSYELLVHVENVPSNPGQVFIASVQFRPIVNGAVGDKVDDLIFTNTFIREHTDAARLRIPKVVDGDFANRAQYFSFTATITIPSLITTYTGVNSYRAYVLDTVTNTIVTTEANGALPGNNFLVFQAGVPRNFALRHNQVLVFADTHVGMRYTLTELAVANYEPQVTVVTNGIPVAITNPGTVNTALTIPSQLLGENTNTADFVNVHHFVPPTGLITGNFMLVLIIAALATIIAAGTILHRRNRDSIRPGRLLLQN